MGLNPTFAAIGFGSLHIGTAIINLHSICSRILKYVNTYIICASYHQEIFSFEIYLLLNYLYNLLNGLTDQEP